MADQRDVLKEDMEEVGAREDGVFDRRVWRIRCGDPWWESGEKNMHVTCGWDDHQASKTNLIGIYHGGGGNIMK